MYTKQYVDVEPLSSQNVLIITNN